MDIQYRESTLVSEEACTGHRPNLIWILRPFFDAFRAPTDLLTGRRDALYMSSGQVFRNPISL
jgi:hypothetical protein